MRIPENLAPECYPLGWLVDSWQGGGVLEYAGIDPAAYLHEVRIDNQDGGAYLRVSSTIWLAKEPASAVVKEAPGQVTFDQLTKDRVWATSTGYLRPVAGPARPDGTTELEGMLASPAGNVQLWVGLIKGPRLNLVMDGIARSATAATLEDAKLVVGYVDSDMFYAYDMAAFGSEMRGYLAGRLSRQFDDTVDGPAPDLSEIPDDASSLIDVDAEDSGSAKDSDQA